MKRRFFFVIVSFIIVVSFTGCKNISEQIGSETNGLAMSDSPKLKINRAGDLNEKPSISAGAKVNNTSNQTNTQLQANGDVQKTVFKPGDKGEQVTEIQKKLNNFGYSILLDGDYGEQTQYAIMDFQFRHNLEIDGIISGKTYELLNKTPDQSTKYKAKAQSVLSASTSKDAAIYENEVNSIDCPSYTNYLIVVNLSKQQVYIFNGSNCKWKLINTFSCASGKSSTPTIKGNFYVGDKGTEFTPGNGIYCKYYSQISGNYLFHSILYDLNGKVVDSTLGETASHGCVRLALENAKYIYDNVPIGSGIWIH